MNLEIPEDANVQIFIGTPAPLALADKSAASTGLAASPGGSRKLLNGAFAVALLAVAFALGQHSVVRSPRTELASNRTSASAQPHPAPETEQHAFPDGPLPRDLAQGGDGQIPPDFRRQLQQIPAVVPAPGAPAPTAEPGRNAFGLEN